MMPSTISTHFFCSSYTVSIVTEDDDAVQNKVLIGLERSFSMKAVIGVTLLRCDDGALFNVL